MEFVSRFYPLPFLRLAQVRVCPCLLKKAVALCIGERVSSALVFPVFARSENLCTSYDAFLLCFHLLGRVTS